MIMAQPDRSSWQVKDTAILHELIQLMGVTAEDSAILATLKPYAQANSAVMVKEFYDRLFSHEQTAEYFQGISMERLHSMVADWFQELFSGTYDTSYAQKRLNIGHIHVRIGLPVRYPLAMLDVVATYGERVAMHSSNPTAAIAAFRKVIALDVAIFNQAYEDNQLVHLAELVGGERLARRLLTGSI